MDTRFPDLAADMGPTVDASVARLDPREATPTGLEELTPAEAGCCHFQQWGLDGQPLSQWRAEFATIPRAEKCRDCPALAQ